MRSSLARCQAIVWSYCPRKPRLIFVGGFHPDGRGGTLKASLDLLEAGLEKYFDVIPLDTTQVGVARPPLAVRARSAGRRLIRLVQVRLFGRPNIALIFSTDGWGFVEKSLMAAFLRWTGVPVVFSVRSGGFLERHRRYPKVVTLTRPLLSVPNVLIAQGGTWAHFYTHHVGLDPSNCVIIPNWSADPDLLTIERSDESSACTFLFVGRIERSKGIFDLLTAFSNARRLSRVPLRLLIAGDGTAMGELAKAIRDTSLAPYVQLLGWCSSERLQALYREASVFVLPSYAEGLPNALVEAMAAGLPLVATSVGSIPDVVTDRHNGFLFEPGHTSHLASILVELSDDLSLRLRLGATARQQAADVHTPQAGLHAVTELLYLLLGRPSPQADTPLIP